MQIQCCVGRTLLEEEEGIPDKEADVIKLQPIPWYGNASLPPPPPRIVTSLPRTYSNATTLPN